MIAPSSPRDLRRRVEVRVVHVRAGVIDRELVGEGLARHDRWLRDVGNAVHPVRNRHAVGVEDRRLLEFVVKDDLHVIAEVGTSVGPGTMPL